MEGKKRFGIVVVLFWSLTLHAPAQTKQNPEFYIAYISGDMVRWQQEIKRLEAARPDSESEKLELLNGYYGLIGWLIGNGNKKEASEFIKRGEKIIGEILEKNEMSATAWALKGAFYGFSIGVQPVKAMFLGPRSNKCVNTALKIDPDNIQGLLEKANILFYSPILVGGDKSLSAEYYEKVVQKMEQLQLTEKSWLYLSTRVQQAQILENAKEYANALEIYKLILEQEPDFTWVKNELYPDLKKRF